MICIYCGNATSVNNSRKQRGGQAIWRRRQCSACEAIFTTIEQADLAAALRVEHASGAIEPFSRDALFYSIAVSCGHRKKSALTDAASLTDTVIRNILRLQSPLLPTSILSEQTLGVLGNFDSAAASYYRAYFV